MAQASAGALPSAMCAVTVTRAGADKQCMTPHPKAVAPATDDKDFGMAGHLAAIELMHREALAQIDALVRPWAHLWAARSDEPSCATEEFPVAGQSPVRAAA